jgi:hypothetical protein
MGNTLLKKTIANYQKAIDIPSPTRTSNFQVNVNGNDERQRRSVPFEDHAASLILLAPT